MSARPFPSADRPWDRPPPRAPAPGAGGPPRDPRPGPRGCCACAAGGRAPPPPRPPGAAPQPPLPALARPPGAAVLGPRGASAAHLHRALTLGRHCRGGCAARGPGCSPASPRLSSRQLLRCPLSPGSATPTLRGSLAGTCPHGRRTRGQSSLCPPHVTVVSPRPPRRSPAYRILH